VLDPTALTGNDIDPDGDAASLAVASLGGATNGDAWLDPSGEVHIIAATPGTGEATYVVTDDGGATASAIVRLTVQAATPDPTVPAAPTGLAGTPGDASVALAWEAPDDGGSPITGYVVQHRATGTAAWFEAALGTLGHDAAVAPGASMTSAIVSGLVNGTSYDFRVAARSEIGTGAFSSAVAATPLAPAPPVPPATSPTEPSPPTTSPGGGVAAPTTTAPVVAPITTLPATGQDVRAAVRFGAAVALVGLSLVVVARRRRRPPQRVR
jgi:hypothetical protein